MKHELRMEWMVKQIEDGTIQFVIKDTGKRKGTVVMPTGTGKEGVIIADLISRVISRVDLPTSKKLIINITAPTLLLVSQIFEDIFEVFKNSSKIYPYYSKIEFFKNSSADKTDYMTCEKKVNDFETEFSKFISNPEKKIAIVASCNKSLYKFADCVETMREYAEIVCYIDEAHEIISSSRDDLKIDEDNEKVKTLRKICKCDYVYALTATPDKSVTKIINEEAGYGGRGVVLSQYYIYHLSAEKCIEDGIILKPHPMWIQVSDNSDFIIEDELDDCFVRTKKEKNRVYNITAEVCKKFFYHCKKISDPSLRQKLLITCNNTNHLLKLEEDLRILCPDIPVFYTTAKTGATARYDSYSSSKETMNDVDFCKVVDEYDGDCFVLHIKKMRSGLDIKTLSGGIIYNATRLNDGVKRMIIQLIGRFIRTKKGERGHPETKKCGHVLFCIGDDDYDAVQRQTSHLLTNYYGKDGIMAFTNDISTPGSLTGCTKGEHDLKEDYVEFEPIELDCEIEDLRIKIKDYIKTVAKEMVETYDAMGWPIGEDDKELLLSDLSKFNKFGDEDSVVNLLSNRDFIGLLNEEFKVMEIKF